MSRDEVVVDIFDYVATNTTPPPVCFSSSPPSYNTPHSTFTPYSSPSSPSYNTPMTPSSTPPMTPYPSPSTSHFHHLSPRHNHNTPPIPFAIETSLASPIATTGTSATTSQTHLSTSPPSATILHSMSSVRSPSLSPSPLCPYDVFPVYNNSNPTSNTTNPFIEKPVRGAPPAWSLDDVKNWTKLIALKKFATYRSDGDHPSAFSPNVTEAKLGFKNALGSAVRKLEATREVDRLTVDFKSKISVEKKNNKKKLRKVIKSQLGDLEIDIDLDAGNRHID